jgi:hypothetical protein
MLRVLALEEFEDVVSSSSLPAVYTTLAAINDTLTQMVGRCGAGGVRGRRAF